LLAGPIRIGCGSQKVVESCGGVLEGTVPDAESGVQKRRYWISVAR